MESAYPHQRRLQRRAGEGGIVASEASDVRDGADRQFLGYDAGTSGRGHRAFFASFDTYLAPFIRKDRLPYEEVKQSIQELIYNLNVPSRWGTQTPFTNLTFDWTCPEDLKSQHPLIGGEEMPFTYGELQPEMDMINRAYIEVMMKGDAEGASHVPDSDLQHHAGL